jgi:hypothetical protein
VKGEKAVSWHRPTIFCAIGRIIGLVAVSLQMVHPP